MKKMIWVIAGFMVLCQGPAWGDLIAPERDGSLHRLSEQERLKRCEEIIALTPAQDIYHVSTAWHEWNKMNCDRLRSKYFSNLPQEQRVQVCQKIDVSAEVLRKVFPVEWETLDCSHLLAKTQPLAQETPQPIVQKTPSPSVENKSVVSPEAAQTQEPISTKPVVFNNQTPQINTQSPTISYLLAGMVAFGIALVAFVLLWRKKRTK